MSLERLENAKKLEKYAKNVEKTGLNLHNYDLLGEISRVLSDHNDRATLFHIIDNVKSTEGKFDVDREMFFLGNSEIKKVLEKFNLYGYLYKS